MTARLAELPIHWEGEPSTRVPPHSESAEQAVLGGLMLSSEAFDLVAGSLLPEHFYSKRHQVLYEAICELVEQGRPYDAVTISDWVDSNKRVVPIEPSYVIHLANTTPSAANIAAYAEIVREKATLRKLLEASVGITEMTLNPHAGSAKDVIEQAEQSIFRIAESGKGNRKDFYNSRDVARQAFGIISSRFDNRGKLTGVSTGFTDLDKLTAGLQPSDLIIVAARPSMGKTAFSVNLAESAAISTKKAVVVFSMEMSAAQLGLRLVSSIGRVDQQHLRNGDIQEEDWPRITHATTVLTETKIYIDDTPALSPADLRARARRIHRESGGLALIVVDYLQLMQVPGNQENRATEISEISRSLKALAKELDIPVIALSQLNRSLESRADKRPLLSDLRESGAIEQDADVIMFIYRDDYYHKDSPDRGLAEIIVGKQRNGPTDTIKLTFLGKYTSFQNYAGDTFEASF